MTVLFEVQACEIQLFVGFDILRKHCGFGCIRYGLYVVGLGMPVEHGSPVFLNFKGQRIERDIVGVNRQVQYRFGRYVVFFVKKYL